MANSQQPTANSQQPTANSQQPDIGFSPDTLAQRRQQLLAAISQIEPGLLCDNQLNLERLKELLGQEHQAGNEHYELTWAGKADSRRESQKVSSHTLRPAANNPQNAQHMFIEGENLEVLRVLQKSYFGKVKMIYIDPPYNTGNDSFVYPDDYSETLEEYQRRTGERDEAGYLNKQSLWKKNSKESGHYHSAWLSMMYPRLYLARNMLVEDGVIFINIGDDESGSLKILLDDIFGRENFISQVVWKKKTNANNMGLMPSVNDYVMVYAKSVSCIRDDEFGVSFDEEYWLKRYSNPDGDHRGPWTTMDLSANHEGPYFAIKNPKTGEDHYPPVGRYWVFSKEEVDSRILDGRIIFGKNGDARPVQKVFLRDRSNRLKKVDTWWDDCGMNSSATEELGALLGSPKIFPHPKPVSLVRKMMEIVLRDEGVVLDFFAGSGTTAQAVMELNLEDGGNRQCICVQMPEALDEGSEAWKAGYRTIADITRARIDKVIAKLKAEHPDKTQDLACAQFTLAPSNFQVWRSEPVSVEHMRAQLQRFQQTEKADVAGQGMLPLDSADSGFRTVSGHDVSQQGAAPDENAMLTELLLKQGLGVLGVHAISKPMQKAGVTVHRVLMDNDRVMWVCFQPYNDGLKEEIVKARPAQVVLLNSCFTGGHADQQLSNLQLEAAEQDIGLLIV